MSPSIAAVQAAIDRARRLGQPIAPPVAPRAGSVSSVPSRSSAPPGVSSFGDLIREASTREGVDPALVSAVVSAESGFNPQAVSAAGAKGLMQLMDGTARSLGVRDAFDPAQNIAGGVKYLRQMLDKYGGDVKRAVAAYNAGPGAVDNYGGIPPYAETQSYVQRVLSLRDQLGGQIGGLTYDFRTGRAGKNSVRAVR